MLEPSRITPPTPNAATLAARGASAVVALLIPTARTVAARASSGAGWHGRVVDVEVDGAVVCATLVGAGVAVNGLPSPPHATPATENNSAAAVRRRTGNRTGIHPDSNDRAPRPPAPPF